MSDYCLSVNETKKEVGRMGGYLMKFKRNSGGSVESLFLEVDTEMAPVESLRMPSTFDCWLSSVI